MGFRSKVVHLDEVPEKRMIGGDEMKKIKYFVSWVMDSVNPETGLTEEKEMLVGIEAPYSEANAEIAKNEAVNGEYTIEDDGQPEPEAQQTAEERIAELEAALSMLLSGVTK